jgi:hypothetical protein
MPKTDSLPLLNKRTSGIEAKPLKFINTLEGRCAYFPLADYHNLKIFNTIKKPVDDDALLKEVNDRLLHYLLIYDVIIMHSSDPLRSAAIFNILNDNSLFIENGDILFVFSNSIKNIETDYKPYIQRKITEYKKIENSKLDVESLQQEHMTDGYYGKTIELLQKSKFILVRNERGRTLFKSLIKDDLQKAEQICISEVIFQKSEVKLLSLNLWQLLNLMVKKTNGYEFIFPNEVIQSFITEWEENADDGRPFSRHTITSKLKNEIIEQQENRKEKHLPEEHLMYAVENRLSLLYSKLNCKDHYILELNPNLENNSSCSWYFLKSFLNKLSGKDIELNKDMVIKIRLCNDWKQFIHTFALSMCDLKMAFSAAQTNERKYFMPTNSLYQIVLEKLKLEKEFSETKKILLGE